ncbi:MAG: ACT domain-containing protein [Oscillospiraceae bacterium]|nr:ACT domain-containing protein [Oscillospiraceae bacterium]
MNDNHKYYIVEDSALPEVLIRCVKAKEYLSSGRGKTVGEAAAYAGISRSAFYKYKDLISPFSDMSLGHIITFSMILRDEPGVLSGILAHFAGNGANVLTIYQTIPSGGRAPVTISADTTGMNTDLDSFIERAMGVSGVISFGPLAGQ